MSKKHKYKNGIRYNCPSVGSDESGTGGLFGKCTFAAFKLTRSNLEQLRKFSWFSEITDSKDLPNEKNIQMLEGIKNDFKKNEDYCIWNIEINTYNTMFKRIDNGKNDIFKSPNKIKCIAHNFIHKQLQENTTFHVLDNFLGQNTSDYYECDGDEIFKKIVPIDKFVSKGEHNILSIAIASILARGSYLKNLECLQKDLKIEISDTDNHDQDIEKIELILNQIEKQQGIEREQVYANYCKTDQVIKYNEKLSKFNKRKGKKFMNVISKNIYKKK